MVSSCGVIVVFYSCHFGHFSEKPPINAGLFEHFSLGRKSGVSCGVNSGVNCGVNSGAFLHFSVQNPYPNLEEMTFSSKTTKNSDF